MPLTDWYYKNSTPYPPPAPVSPGDSDEEDEKYQCEELLDNLDTWYTSL